MAVSNATAAVIERAPAYITYRVHGIYRAQGEGRIERTVTVRTDDGVAVVHDENDGKDSLRAPFPASPTFDALSKFELSGAWTIALGNRSKKDFDMSVKNVQPLHYEFTASHADAVARAVKGYVIAFAPDSTPALAHLQLERSVTMHEDRWLRDVWYDPATMIPSRIRWGGTDAADLDTRYALVDGRWLVHSISLSFTLHAPMFLVRKTVSFEGQLTDYAFAERPPDPRLAPSPPPASPTPAK